MSTSSTNSVNTVEVTTTKLQLAYDESVNNSSILITAVEKESNQVIKMRLKSGSDVSVINADSVKPFLECNANFSKFFTDDNQYKLVTFFLKKKILITKNDCLFVVLQLPLVHDADLIHSNIDDDTLIRSTIQKGYIDIMAMLLKSVDKNGQTLQQYIFFNTEEYEIANGDVEIIKILLGCQANVNMKNKNGQTLLHIALNRRRLFHDGFEDQNPNVVKALENIDSKFLHPTTKCIQTLVSLQANINAVDKDGQTALLLALNYGDLETIEILLKKNSDFSIQDNYGRTALHIAIQKLPIHEMYLENIANVDIEDKDREISLYCAVRNQALNIMKIFLENPAVVNAQNMLGQTALHLAVQRGDLEVVNILLNKNSDVNIKDRKGETALYCTSNIYIGFQYNDYYTEEKRQKITEALLNAGANPNAEGNHGGVLLSRACKTNDLFIVEILLKNNADVNFKDKDGQTPLHCVIQKKYIDHPYSSESRLKFVEILLKNNADVNITAKNDETPLHYATQIYEAHHIVEFLLKNKANVNIKSNSGRTPLHYASKTRNLEIIKTLLNNDADISVRDEEGQTPLHYVACGDYGSGIHDHEAELKSVIAILINKIDIDDKDKDGRTPLHLACNHEEYVHFVENVPEYFEYYNLDLFSVLIDNGADINILDKYNKTPMKILFENKANWYNNDNIIHRNLLPFKEHIVKLKCAKLYVCKQNLDMVYDPTDEYYLEWNTKECESTCVEELARMRLEKIPHSNISIFKILGRSIHDAVNFIFNEYVLQSLSSVELETKFPLYANILKRRFTEGKIRGKLLKKAQLCTRSSIFKKLLEICIHEIFRYLTNNELLTLINAMKSVVDVDQ